MWIWGKTELATSLQQQECVWLINYLPGLTDWEKTVRRNLKGHLQPTPGKEIESQREDKTCLRSHGCQVSESVPSPLPHPGALTTVQFLPLPFDIFSGGTLQKQEWLFDATDKKKEYNHFGKLRSRWWHFGDERTLIWMSGQNQKNLGLSFLLTTCPSISHLPSLTFNLLICKMEIMLSLTTLKGYVGSKDIMCLKALCKLIVRHILRHCDKLN